MSKTFVTLTPEEFDKFAEKSPISNFQQSSAWANLKVKNGWKDHFVGVKDDKIVAAALILEKPLPMHRSMFYAPHGPLLDYNDSSLLKFFTEHLKAYAKEHRAIFCKINPEIINIERDINGAPLENGENNTKIVENLKKLGFKHHGFKTEGNIEPQYTFVLNINGRSVDDLYNGLKGAHRTRIRQNEKNHVTVRQISYEELPEFKKIMVHTADRRGFTDRPLEYYQNFWQALGDRHIIYFSEVNLKEYEASVTAEKAVLDEKLAKLNKNLESTSHKEKIEKQIASVNQDISELENRLKKCASYKKQAKNDILTLGALQFVRTNREITSVFGGNYGDFREFNSAYSLNWEMIKYAAENSYQKYNFYGISEFKNPKDPSFGLYEFKRGFGGQVEEYIGEFDLITSKFWYLGYKLAYELPKNLRRRKNNKKFAKKEN